MASNVMFLQLRLTLPKPKLSITIFVSCFLIILGSFLVLQYGQCSVDKFVISQDLENWQENLDPEDCENILDRIYQFNDQCEENIEIVDCG